MDQKPTTRQLLSDIDAILTALTHAANDNAKLIERVDPGHRHDAENLVHYVTLRQRDERQTQRALSERGLSSLGGCEPHVLASVTAVRGALEGEQPIRDPALTTDLQRGRAALDANTDALFGPRPPHRVTRIMVTLPTEAATSYELVHALVERGMDVARINCAHDSPTQWQAMAVNVRKAAQETGQAALISMDLPGPKLRTGPLTDGPSVVRIRARRDARGVALSAARVYLVDEGDSSVEQRRPDGPNLPDTNERSPRCCARCIPGSTQDHKDLAAQAPPSCSPDGNRTKS